MPARFSPDNLAALLDASGKRPEHLAVATGRSFYTIRGYAKGVIEPPARVIAVIADELGCEIGDLFEIDDDVTAVS